MNDQERLAIVWNQIERLAFKPASTTEQKSWLSICGKSLHQLWECDPISLHLSKCMSFDIPLLGVEWDYRIESLTKYSLAIKTSKSTLWTIHCDPQYEVKPVLAPSERYPNAMGNQQLEKDVTTVLDGMLFHPCCHSHLEEIGSWAAGNSSPNLHDIRISSAEPNPFIFMFQLRFQFCIISIKKREEEKSRITTLFLNAIKTGSNVPPSNLFGFRLSAVSSL
ncbi:MAG: hypothetical protein L3J39_13870 [Verrucomicrobiales bacterium]|nr:hypothetical protein [Verrucomicrobiales bacterium]